MRAERKQLIRRTALATAPFLSITKVSTDMPLVVKQGRSRSTRGASLKNAAVAKCFIQPDTKAGIAHLTVGATTLVESQPSWPGLILETLLES